MRLWPANRKPSRVHGTVKTESERDALAAAVTDSGVEVDDQISVSPDVEDSDPRVVAALVAPLLVGTDDGELALANGTMMRARSW